MDLDGLNRLYEEHWRLLYEAGQTPPIALLIRLRTLEVLLDRFPGPQAWIAYGYGIAEQVLETAAESVLAFDDAQFERLVNVLEYAATQGDRTATGPATRLEAGTAEWHDRVNAQITELRRIHDHGAVPKDYAPDWLAVPVVYELLGEPTLPEFAGLSAVGIQWMRLDLEHITPLSTVFAPGSSARGPGQSSARVRGSIDDGTAAYLSEILARLETLVPGNGAWGAAPLAHLAAQIRLQPEIRLRGFSVGMAFLLQLLIARDGARPVPRSFVWTVPTAATGVLDGHRFTEVDHLERKLAACCRAGVRTIFVPGPQESIARDLCSRRGLSLEVLGLHRSEDAGRVASRASSQLTERTRSHRERLAQAWFWYLRSPLRAAAASAALLAILTALVAVFWPVPTSCDWPEGERFVLRNWLGIPVAHPKTGHRPGDEMSNGPWLGEFWEVLPRSGEPLPVIVVMWGTVEGRIDVLALLDWRGRVVQTWNVDDDPALLPEDDGGMVMSRFQVRETAAGRQVLVVPSRAVSQCLSIVRVFEHGRMRLMRRGYAWNYGHLESFPELDANGDGTRDQLCLGWAQYLTTEGIEAPDLDRGQRGRNVAYVLDLDALASGDWAEAPRSGIPNLTLPDARRFGLLVAWSFPLDPFSSLLSNTCRDVRRTGAGDLRFNCATTEEYSIDYTLRADRDFTALLIDVEPTSFYFDHLVSLGWSPDSIAVVLDRLATQITQGGERWAPVPVAH